MLTVFRHSGGALAFGSKHGEGPGQHDGRIQGKDKSEVDGNGPSGFGQQFPTDSVEPKLRVLVL